mgnify:CR=1 FL=1
MIDWINGLDAHWFWLIVGGLLGIAEILIPGFFLIWLSVAAIVTGIVAFVLPISMTAQVALFAVLAVATVYAGRRWFALNPIESTDPNLNDRGARLIGELVLVVEAIEAAREAESTTDVAAVGDADRRVARRTQLLLDERHGVGDADIDHSLGHALESDPVSLLVEPREHRGVRRRRAVGGDESALVDRARARQFVEKWGGGSSVTVGPESVGAQGIDRDQKNVGSRDRLITDARPAPGGERQEEKQAGAPSRRGMNHARTIAPAWRVNWRPVSRWPCRA